MKRMKWYFIILGLIILAFALLRCSKKELLVYPFKKATLNPDAKQFIELLNNYRKENNLCELKVDETASLLALEHVFYMAENGVSHDNLDERRSELALEGAENIMEVVCGGYSTVNGSFLGFTNSPKHDAILLSNKINACGISINEYDKKKIVAVIFFNI